MKILITGVTSCHNRGVDALVRSLLDTIFEKAPHAEITILSSHPDFDSEAFAGYKVSFIQHERDTTFRSLKNGIRQHLFGSPHQKRLECAIADADWCLATGGDVFTSDYRSLEVHLKPLRIAIKRGVRFGFIGHTIGPFKSDRETKAWVEVARKASFISVREEISREYVKTLLNRPSDPEVIFAADSAFLLKPSPDQANLAQAVGLRSGKTCVGLAISRSITKILGESNAGHFSAWKGVIEKILSETDWDVLLIPHVQGTHATGNDLIMQTKLMRELRWPERIKCAGANLNSAEYKALLARCDLVVAERMHAGVAALSSAVPTILVSYSVKFRGILLGFFPAKMVDDTLLLRLEKFLERPEELWRRLRVVFDERAAIHATLRQTLPAVKERAELNFKWLAGTTALATTTKTNRTDAAVR